MLNQQTLEKLQALRLLGMAEAFRTQAEQPDITQLSFEERFALLVDQQWNWKQNRALARRLANAKLRHRASVEDIDFRSPHRTQVFKQAAAFAMLKKYETKCDEWVGLGWDLGSAGAVDVAFFVSHPWAYDEQMERLVTDKLRPGQRIDP
jgi:hypothetical protein